MPGSPHARDALLQRLPPPSAADCRLHGDHAFEWQTWRLYCGALPLSACDKQDYALELCPLWPHSPLTPGLLLGGDPQALAACQPLLQQLAGHAHASLYCGPLGAAGFCLHVFNSLFYLAGPGGLATPSPAPSTPDWVALLARQQQVTDKLAALCQRYLHRHSVTTLPQDPAAVLAAFRQPPPQQSHYALNLATLLALTLELGAPARQLLDALLAAGSPPPPKATTPVSVN